MVLVECAVGTEELLCRHRTSSRFGGAAPPKYRGTPSAVDAWRGACRASSPPWMLRSPVSCDMQIRSGDAKPQSAACRLATRPPVCGARTAANSFTMDRHRDFSRAEDVYKQPAKVD